MTQTMQARTSWTTRLALAAASAMLAAQPVFAEDQLKLTIGQRGNWDTAISQLGIEHINVGRGNPHPGARATLVALAEHERRSIACDRGYHSVSPS